MANVNRFTVLLPFFQIALDQEKYNGSLPLTAMQNKVVRFACSSTVVCALFILPTDTAALAVATTISTLNQDCSTRGL